MIAPVIFGLLLLQVVERNGREGVLVNLLDPEVVQIGHQALLVFGAAARFLLDACEAGQPTLVVLAGGERSLGLLLVPVPVDRRLPRLVLRGCQHLLPVNGPLLPLRQLALLRNTVL